MLSSPIIDKQERLTAHESSFFEHSTIVPIRPSVSAAKGRADTRPIDAKISLRKRPSHGERVGFFEIFELHDRLPRNFKGVSQINKISEVSQNSAKSQSLERKDGRMTECFTLSKIIDENPSGASKSHKQSLNISHVDSVWLASYRATGKEFAVKFLWSPLRSQSISHRRIIQSQVDIQRKFKHPYIARLSGFLKNIPIVEDPKLQACALITDYVPHGSLDDQLSTKRQGITGRPFFYEPEAQKILSQLCSALRYMHNTHHVVHCDVKLANVLYDSDKQQIKLIDFGLAWNFAKEKNFQLEWTQNCHNEKQFLRKGTLNYLSPEQVQGNVQCNSVTKIDVWAVGVCAFELLTGVSPFARDSELSTRQAILKGTINETTQGMMLSQSANSFIQDCFQKDPQQRPSLDVLMKHSWLNVECSYPRG